MSHFRSGSDEPNGFCNNESKKNRGNLKKDVEVGSWVIGYWKPKLHFEINVWNCFENRARKLSKTLKSYNGISGIPINPKGKNVINGKASISISKGDALKTLKTFPEKSIHVILTDPPHSDRIPYLELSELWNYILKEKPDFKSEIVVSNAKERNKTKQRYAEDIFLFLKAANRVLVEGGVLALMFNARDKESWAFYEQAQTHIPDLTYKGYFPVKYSANSVVQDNRSGSLKDYVLIFSKKTNGRNFRIEELQQHFHWKNSAPSYG